MGQVSPGGSYGQKALASPLVQPPSASAQNAITTTADGDWRMDDPGVEPYCGSVAGAYLPGTGRFVSASARPSSTHRDRGMTICANGMSICLLLLRRHRVARSRSINSRRHGHGTENQLEDLHAPLVRKGGGGG